MMTELTRASARRLGFGLIGLLSAFALGTLPSCHDDEPCDPGQEYLNSSCFPIKTGSGGSSTGTGGANGAGGDSTGETSQFGKTCATAQECAGDAPICAAPQLPVCTQINCAAGEENEGACPPDWTCLMIAPNPSACVKF
jgi:hypothetical protein